VDGTPTNASKMPVTYSPSDLDFTLDFEAIFEGPSVVEIESTATLVLVLTRNGNGESLETTIRSSL
jgi:hypothetical protein